MILEIPAAIMDVFHGRLSWTLTRAISIGVSSKQIVKTTAIFYQI